MTNDPTGLPAQQPAQPRTSGAKNARDPRRFHVSQMVRYMKPINILLVHNRGYEIEVEVRNGSYNRIKNWDYAMLVKASNGEDGKATGFTAKTAGDLAAAIRMPGES